MERWSSALVDMDEDGDSVTLPPVHGVRPWESEDPSSSRVWWSDAGVHQNITFPVHPDPISGMHCWHQKVRVRPAEPDDRYADIHVDFASAHERSTASGSRSRARRPASCDGRSGCSGRSSRCSTPTASPTINGPARHARLWPSGQARSSFTSWSTGRPRRCGGRSRVGPPRWLPGAGESVLMLRFAALRSSLRRLGAASDPRCNAGQRADVPGLEPHGARVGRRRPGRRAAA